MLLVTIVLALEEQMETKFPCEDETVVGALSTSSQTGALLWTLAFVVTIFLGGGVLVEADEVLLLFG